MLPAEYIIRDHHRLGSSYVILSRSFCNTSALVNLEEIRSIFQDGVREIRQIEEDADLYSDDQFADNHAEVQKRVAMVVDIMRKKN